MREEYIAKIIELLNSCNDVAMLDLVFQLLREG